MRFSAAVLSAALTAIATVIATAVVLVGLLTAGTTPVSASAPAVTTLASRAYDAPANIVQRSSYQCPGAVATAAGGAVLASISGRIAAAVFAAEDAGGIAGVETPYGPASQDTSPEAMAARGQVEAGAPLYRVGTLGKSQAAEAQFWALEHPATPVTRPYGIPPENVVNSDFIEQGRLVDGTPFVTRAAPAVGTNPGGGIEVVVPPGGVDLNWFSVLEGKG